MWSDLLLIISVPSLIAVVAMVGLWVEPLFRFESKYRKNK